MIDKEKNKEEITKDEIYLDVIRKTEGEKEKKQVQLKLIIENMAIIISLSTVWLFLLLYSYNTGRYEVYNIPVNHISSDLREFLPVAVRVLGLYMYLVYYISQFKKDTFLKITKLNLIRIMYGVLIINTILVDIELENLIPGYMTIIISVFITITVEIVYLVICKHRNKTKNKTKRYSGKVKDIVFLGILEDRMVSLTFNIFIGISAVIIIAASLWGNLIAHTENNYLTFNYEDETYVVIKNRENDIIAEKVSIEADKLTIFTSSFWYISKENIEFVDVEYKEIIFENSTK